MAALPQVVDNPFGSRVVAMPTGTALTEALAQREVAEVQAMAIMAKKFPRDPIVAMDRILQACTRPTLAEAAIYEYGRGGSTVSGPSIRLAEAIAQNWGNILTGVDIIASSEKASECVAYAWDVETGARDQKRFTVRHWRDTKKGGYALTDERDIYELCANMGARRKRACILAVIPGDVVEAAVDQCDRTLRTKIEITPEYIASLLAAFEKFGVTKAMLEKRIQRHIDAMTPALAMQLKKIYASLKDGMSAAADWFEVEPQDTDSPAPAGNGRGNEGVKAALRGGEQKVAQRFDDAEPQGAKPAAVQQPEPAQSPVKKKATKGAAPEPYTDEALALLALDGANEEGEASAIVDLCKGQPFYSRIVEAFNKRFSETVG